MKKLLCIGIVLMFANALFAEDSAKKAETVRLDQVAVYELDHDSSVSKGEAEAILSRFQTELLNTQKYNILDRNKIGDILSEQAFTESGTCSEENCMVQVGQLLGVEKMVFGKLNTVGSLKTLNMNMIDVTTGKIEQSYAVDVHGGVEEILTKSARNIARKMAGLPVEDKSLVTLNVSSSTVWWVTGASVLGGGVALATWYFFFNKPAEAEKVSRTDVLTIQP